MQSDPYKIVSNIYDHLMKKLSYQDWANYISDIKTVFKDDSKSYLELACGTGKLRSFLKHIFDDIVMLDISDSMLQKVPSECKRVCASMTRMPFKNEFDFIYSTFDSINYITDEEEILKYFYEVRNILSKDGVFTFDASLEKNSLKNSKRLNRSGMYKGIAYKQTSEYNKSRKLHTNQFRLELDNGEIINEVHTQKIYDFDFYFDVSDLAGLNVIGCYESFTFEDASPENERVQFIMKKNNADI